MAHNPLSPGEHIAPNMHGFDPLSKDNARLLINEFRDFDPAKGIDKTQRSFYLDSDTLTSLLQGERNTNSDYDGFRVMFGLDAHNRIVLLINRVRITEDQKGIRHFEYVPQLDTIGGKGNHEVILMEYALVTVTISGHTLLHRIDINETEYRQLRLNFQTTFADDNPLITYRTTARSILKTLGHQLDSPLTVKQRHFVTGFYIGWGTLNLIRDELSMINKGIKLWLGYGTLTRNPHSAKCLHLVAIAADDPGDTVDGYSKPTVWSTQDQTRSERKLDNRIAAQPGTVLPQPTLLIGTVALMSQLAAPLEFPQVLPPGEVVIPIYTLGSSCSDPATDTI